MDGGNDDDKSAPSFGRHFLINKSLFVREEEGTHHRRCCPSIVERSSSRHGFLSNGTCVDQIRKRDQHV
jgi:hypothetical protein